MFSYITFYSIFCIFIVFSFFFKNWQLVVLLALAELCWISLCAAWGLTFIETGDIFFIYWATVMLFFSAIELVVSSVLFLYQSTNTSSNFMLK